MEFDLDSDSVESLRYKNRHFRRCVEDLVPKINLKTLKTSVWEKQLDVRRINDDLRCARHLALLGEW